MTLKTIVSTVLSYIPERLPVGLDAHDSWAADVVALSGLPDNDSMRFAVATMILHADAKAAYLAKQYFVRRLIKGAANQVAGGIMQDLKNKQAEELAKAQAVKQVEATTPTEGASTDGQSQTTQN